MLNDHCMWWYNSNCDCIQYIIATFEALNINFLELKNVHLQVKLPLHVEKVYLIDCRFDVDILSSITNLKRLMINSNYEYYYPDPFWTQQIELDGLCMPHLEYFDCNGFIFEDQLRNFIDNSHVIDSLKLFRIQTLMDEENDYTDLSAKIKEKFKNAKVEVYL